MNTDIYWFWLHGSKWVWWCVVASCVFTPGCSKASGYCLTASPVNSAAGRQLPLQGSAIAPNSWPGQIPRHIKTPSIRFYQILSPSPPSPDAVGKTWRNTNFAWVWEDDRANSINKRQQAWQKSVQNATLVFLFYAHSANRLPSSSRMPPTEALCRNKLRDPCNDPRNMGR